jgi:hypothetical protein
MDIRQQSALRNASAASGKTSPAITAPLAGRIQIGPSQPNWLASACWEASKFGSDIGRLRPK